MTSKSGERSAETLITINDLDNRLKKQAASIVKIINPVDWRESLRPDGKAWWWFLDSPETLAPPPRLFVPCRILTVLAGFVSIFLFFEIFKPFLFHRPDFKNIVFPIFLAIIGAGGITGVVGGLNKLLVKRSRSYFYFREFLLTVVCLVALLCVYAFLPGIANNYSEKGRVDYDNGRLAGAQNNFKLALALNPNHMQTHYNLGRIYEDLLDFKNARAKYQIARKGGFAPAHNNLARLYILDGKYSDAVSLLLNGLESARHDEVKYDFLKNLGWARLNQKRYDESETRLKEAIKIRPEKAPTHCLMALALEGRDDAARAGREWEICRQTADSSDPDEDA